MTLYARRIGTPLGEMVVAVDEGGSLAALEFRTGGSAEETLRHVAQPGERVEWSDGHCAEVVAQLEEYFAGERREFDLPLAPRGTPFQQRVWHELVRIPYGSTISYGELAGRLGMSSARASRAVGQANATNPIAIVVPCHRVIGADGTLTGYAAGLSFKAKLLTLEGALAPEALLHGAPRVRERTAPAAARRDRRVAGAVSAEQPDLFPQP
jgi:methylated-DNA-[protein]-cysteine S-methyltransferase